jgi:c(7)-type cytochrome triheme protein
MSLKRLLFIALLVVIVIMLFSLLAVAADKLKPELVFSAKNGNVTFLHAKHAERAGKCEVCHDTVFKKDTTTPLNYKPVMHKTAEAGKISCASCHVVGGKAFETKGNCAKCHKK